MKIFITGGTTGIGLSLAHAYLRAGQHVAVCGRKTENFTENFSSPEFKNNVEFYQVDVTNREDLKKAIKDFSQKGVKGLDLLIANAGISMDTKKKIPNFDHALELIKININGVIHAFEGALEVMLPQQRGHLVAISSVAGFVGLPGTSLYSASKAFVTTLCESFSIDLKSEGITTTAICPGFIDTPLTRKNKHPMPFLLPSDEAARRIMWAIDQKWELYVFPKRMNFVITLMKYLPRSIYRFLAVFLGKFLLGSSHKK